MQGNWWRWLWGIIPLLILGWLAVEREHVSLERDLSERSAEALSAAGLNWAIASFQGRDGVLTGRAADVSDPEKAANVLRDVWGVRAVDNKADLIEKVENYVWNASRRGNRVRLTGYVPNAGVRQAILGVARASFPGFEVQDRLKLARGAPSIDSWLGGVSFSLKQLASLRAGEARLDGLSLTLKGEAEDVANYRAVRLALANGVPKGIRLMSAQIGAPHVSPHVWAAKFEGGRLGLTGHVPNEEAQAQIFAAARETLQESNISDATEPGDGVPAGWPAAATLAVRQLVRLEAGSAEIKDGQLTLSGLASDEATATAIRNQLKALPPTIKLADQLRVKPQPKPAEPEPRQPNGENGRRAEAQPVTPPATVAQPAALPTKQPAEPAAAAAPAVKSASTEPVTQSPAPPPPTPAQVRAAKACQDTLRGLAAAGTLLFRYASAQISTNSTETLDKLAVAAKECPEMLIEIGGFASSEGTPAFNLRLSYARARTVLDYLVKAGVDAGQLEAKGYGTDRPVAPNDTLENMAKNRRIEFGVRPKLAGGPPHAEPR